MLNESIWLFLWPLKLEFRKMVEETKGVMKGKAGQLQDTGPKKGQRN